MQDADLKLLVRAVHRWLSFQRMCGRSMMFSESYLTQPIAEFVSTHHSGIIVPELNHPQFAKSVVGRPKQVDFALLTRHSDKIECVIESKWVRDESYSKQAILDDLLRLECFRDKGHVRRYFLAAGLRQHFERNFLNLRYRDGVDLPFLTELLNPVLGSKTKTVYVQSAQGNLRRFYRKFQSAYEVELPKTFRTKLVARSRIDGIAVYLWQIESVQNRRTFDTTDWRNAT